MKLNGTQQVPAYAIDLNVEKVRFFLSLECRAKSGQKMQTGDCKCCIDEIFVNDSKKSKLDSGGN
jgi:hypothetical protein